MAPPPLSLLWNVPGCCCRGTAIAAHYGTSLHVLKDDLHVLALAGQNAALGYPDRNGLIV
jgi:hypothetical protein